MALCFLPIRGRYILSLLAAKPYKRMGHFLLALALQITLFLLFLAAQSVHIFTKLEEQHLYTELGAQAATAMATRVVGFASLDGLVSMMISLNLGVLLVFVPVLSYAYASAASFPLLHIVATKAPAELSLAPLMKYHLFLSHVWSSVRTQALHPSCVDGC
jgi:hypothetical protein